jgi:hypothetical protein
MAKPITGTLTIQLTTGPVAAGADFAPEPVEAHFWQRLEKNLSKRGFQAVRVGGAQPANVASRLELNPGNRLLRYFVPFASPAVTTALGAVTRSDGSVDQHIQARGTAHFGLFGGSPVGMLKAAADRAAASVAKQLGSAPRRAFEPIMPA